MINSANTLTQCEIILPVKLVKKDTDSKKSQSFSRFSGQKTLQKQNLWFSEVFRWIFWMSYARSIYVLARSVFRESAEVVDQKSIWNFSMLHPCEYPKSSM